MLPGRADVLRADREPGRLAFSLIAVVDLAFHAPKVEADRRAAENLLEFLGSPAGAETLVFPGSVLELADFLVEELEHLAAMGA